jgi:hypothetical protein
MKKDKKTNNGTKDIGVIHPKCPPWDKVISR